MTELRDVSGAWDCSFCCPAGYMCIMLCMVQMDRGSGKYPLWHGRFAVKHGKMPGATWARNGGVCKASTRQQP